MLIRHPSGKVYEFVFLSLADLGARYDGDFQKIATSFRQIDASEAAQYNKAQRIRIVTVKAGDTIQSLASRMVVADDKEGWFRVLNGLKNGQQVAGRPEGEDRHLRCGARVVTPRRGLDRPVPSMTPRIEVLATPATVLQRHDVGG